MHDNDPDLRDCLEAATTPPVYTGTESVDRLYDMVLLLTQELAVTRETLALLQGVLQEQGLVAPAQAEILSGNPDFAREQLQRHGDLVRRVVGELPQH